jgi:hypothetical protein
MFHVLVKVSKREESDLYIPCKVQAVSYTIALIFHPDMLYPYLKTNFVSFEALFLIHFIICCNLKGRYDKRVSCFSFDFFVLDVINRRCFWLQFEVYICICTTMQKEGCSCLYQLLVVSCIFFSYYCTLVI